MKTDDYLTRITNYITDTRFSRALLINGNWGCGKTYFVKNILVSAIEGAEVKQNSNAGEDQGKKTYYKTLLVSLYGITSIEAIQELIYTVLLEKYTPGDKDDSIHAFLQKATLFGSAVIKGLGNIFNVGEDIVGLGKMTIDQFLIAIKESIVLIFDDFERCQVDTIELMGFLNNLCENNGYRVIIIANEEEVERKTNDIALAIQKQTALWDLYGKKIPAEIEGRNNANFDSFSMILSKIDQESNDVKDTRFRDVLDEHVDELFERDTHYERTREKLIGLTIQFESTVEEAYEDILKNTVSEEFVDYLIKQKKLIVDSFNETNHQNLRTLISVFIAIECILKSMDLTIPIELDEKCQKYNIDKEYIIEEEKHRIILYIIRTAEFITESNNVFIWKNSRYGCIENGYQSGKSLFGYAFVDEYWTSLVANPETINIDLSNRIIELLTNEVQKIQDKEHFNLSLFKLSEWYIDSDKNVIENIKKLKEELKNREYYSREFKDIICVLMRINNPNYGMMFELNQQKCSDHIYDAVDETLQIRDTAKLEPSKTTYDGWSYENIHEYVDLMVAYFEDDDFEINKEMLRLFSSDSNFVFEYREYIQPLLDRIEEKEIQDLFIFENGLDLFDKSNANFHKFFKDHRDTYITKGQFFSLYGFDRFNNIFLNGSPKEIYQMADAIRSVYNFGNLRDFLADDYAVVDKLWKTLKEDRDDGRKVYNPENSRTREIALRRIERDLSEYKSALRISCNELQ